MPPTRWLFLWSKYMSYTDVVQAIADATQDAQTLEDVVNGEPNAQAKSRLGRLIYSLSTINHRVDVATTQANQKLTDLDNAINAAAAAGAGANGWTDLLIKTVSGKTQRELNIEQQEINDNQKQTNDNYLSKLSNELYVDDYIAKAATIRDGFIAALTDLKNSGGGTLNLGKAKSYLVFTSTSGASTNILDFDQLKNVTINFNGSEIAVDTSNAQAVPRIFNLKNPKNITFNDVRVRDAAEKVIKLKKSQKHYV